MSRPKHETPNPEFNKFKELAKNLLAVPKKEVDAKRADYDRDKNKKERPAK
jgi:hypothetical protein